MRINRNDRLRGSRFHMREMIRYSQEISPTNEGGVSNVAAAGPSGPAQRGHLPDGAQNDCAVDPAGVVIRDQDCDASRISNPATATPSDAPA